VLYDAAFSKRKNEKRCLSLNVFKMR